MTNRMGRAVFRRKRLLQNPPFQVLGNRHTQSVQYRREDVGNLSRFNVAATERPSADRQYPVAVMMSLRAEVWSGKKPAIARH